MLFDMFTIMKWGIDVVRPSPRGGSEMTSWSIRSGVETPETERIEIPAPAPFEVPVTTPEPAPEVPAEPVEAPA